jgi:lipopolysaccharide export system ATP-binding protein
MSLNTGGDFALSGKSADRVSANGADRRSGAMTWAGRLRALFGRKEQPIAAESGGWLLAEADEPNAQAGLDSEWPPEELENWRDDDAPQAPRELLRPSAPRQPFATRPAQPVRPVLPESRAVGEIEGSLIAEALNKTFKGRKIIKDVSLLVHRGEAIGLLGPNGAGKTTLFYMITGLIRPDTGVILLDDYDVTSLPMYRRARLGIGYLPQEPSIFRGLSVEDNIRAVLEITQPDKQKRREELESLLDEFDVARVRKLPAIALSGGERRRCEIARALAGHPSFMLLDEPFAGIDPIAIGEIRLLVQHLKRRGIGVLITDHNVRETLDLIDRAYIIHSGQVLTEGTPEKIVADPQVRRLYLGEGFKL